MWVSSIDGRAANSSQIHNTRVHTHAHNQEEGALDINIAIV